nr:alpha/beta fold hydrolase [Bradyrhizobium neotropicale]
MTISHRFIETNGIRMHLAEAGSGPTVLLCHGFPECRYSWRHQLAALAAAGYRAIAPDMRGYPNLIATDERIDTLAVGSVLITYNSPRAGERYQRLATFVNAFFRVFQSSRVQRGTRSGKRSTLRRSGPGGPASLPRNAG